MNPNIANESRKYWEAFKWTKDEIQIILDNYEAGRSDKEIAELLPKRSLRKVQDKRLSLGLKRLTQERVWSDEEIALLEKHWKDYDQNELHEKFLPNKTPIQINQRKMYSGLKGKKQVWSDEEKATFVEKASLHNNKSLQRNFFKNKSLTQIQDLRHYLKIRILK